MSVSLTEKRGWNNKALFFGAKTGLVLKGNL
jgi:hypothetical protein